MTNDCNNHGNKKGGKMAAERGTFLVIEKSPSIARTTTGTSTSASPLPSPSASSPAYIHCNSKSEFILPPDSTLSRSLSCTSSSLSSLDDTTATTSNHKDNSKEDTSAKITYINSGQRIKVPITNHHTRHDQEDANLAYSSSISLAPTPSSSNYAKEVNKTLNLHLGLPFNPRNIKLVRLVCQTLSYFLSLVEAYLFRGWDSIPLKLRQSITNLAWKLYFPFHKKILGNKTGIHANASYEYHAMTTILYWGRLFPVTIRRMRFSLSQLSSCHSIDSYPVTKENISHLGYVHGNSTHGRDGDALSTMTSSSSISKVKQINGLKAIHVHSVNYNMATLYASASSSSSNYTYCLSNPYRRQNAPFTTNASSSPSPMTDPTHVTGYFIQHNSKPSSKVIFYLYGGAYLSGDSKNNLNYAEKIGQQSSQEEFLDVFLPNYRLLPEYTFFDALYDTCLAYEYLVCVQGYHPKDIVLFGISSGGGLLVRLMQRIVEFQMELQEQQQKEEEGEKEDKWRMWANKLQIVPKGAVLMSPFVDYTLPEGSFVEYKIHDLIVNESVYEGNIQYLQTLGGYENLKRESPVYRSMKGLPSICLIASEHECVYDQNLLLCNNARREGVEVDFGLWKYMCHVWPVWSGFIPESRQAVDFMCDWMKKTCSDETGKER